MYGIMVLVDMKKYQLGIVKPLPRSKRVREIVIAVTGHESQNVQWLNLIVRSTATHLRFHSCARAMVHSRGMCGHHYWQQQRNGILCQDPSQLL